MNTSVVVVTSIIMSSPFFKFKQFTVYHDHCAMKVGTDGVLLGAWCPLNDLSPSVTAILDIGTGSGLIALMTAQRCPGAQIDAIDIDEAAVEQAKENFERAQETALFANRLHSFRVCLQQWQGGPYHLIVSNPPYFQNSLKNPDEGRLTARHTDSLSYADLIKHGARLLAPDGCLALILPSEAETQICHLAAEEGLFPTRITRVYSKESKPARRVMIAFSRMSYAFSPIEDTLVLEDEKGGRSAAYSELCKEFYL